MDMNRRQFFRVSGAGLAASSLVALGFSPSAALAETRAFKLTRATVARSICPYCSVSCGMLIYKLGDGSKNAKDHVIHVEGDPDNPVSRGSLCPKGAGVMDMINSPARIKYPMVREAGGKEWKRIGWAEALNRISKHMKDDRDANFQTTNAAGTTVNRWTSTGFLVCSSSSNESSYLTVKVARGLGMVGIDTQARV
ncbi:MAG: sulfate ABC transporter substrate-binding protein [Ottowia sp.]|jgi:formate dehydrogenase major subunit|nr:MAG: sulfate ABC transporter substrate-binding protein [Burkholderiales bacterium 68-10]TXI14977.1 MAG: sulfate ABC transporter substrate-binding protein [Ottowia sp.]